MARYTGPTSRIARRFGEPIFGPDKALAKKAYGPGQHGNQRRRGKQSEYGVQLMEAFPKTIAEQSLGYGQNDTLHRINVTFSYRYWKNLTDEANLPKPLLDRIAERAVNTVTRRITSQIPSVLRRL